MYNSICWIYYVYASFSKIHGVQWLFVRSVYTRTRVSWGRGGGHKMWLRRITRSSTCVCLRLRNCCFTSRYALFHPCTLVLIARSRALRSRWTVVPSLLRMPTPITSVNCPNECLYQLWARSAQPFGRLGQFSPGVEGGRGGSVSVRVTRWMKTKPIM
jgi:hypothetical protein